MLDTDLRIHFQQIKVQPFPADKILFPICCCVYWLVIWICDLSPAVVVAQRDYSETQRTHLLLQNIKIYIYYDQNCRWFPAHQHKQRKKKKCYLYNRGQHTQSSDVVLLMSSPVSVGRQAHFHITPFWLISRRHWIIFQDHTMCSITHLLILAFNHFKSEHCYTIRWERRKLIPKYLHTSRKHLVRPGSENNNISKDVLGR